MPSREDVADPKAHQEAASQFAVGGHVEKREVARVVGHPEPDSCGPDLPGQQWAFLADDAAFVPSAAGMSPGFIFPVQKWLLERRGTAD